MLLPWTAFTLDYEKGKAIGNPSAPIRIEVYSDFECPACKGFHDQTLPALERDYVVPGKVFLIFRDFPLPQHQYSRQEAYYADAAAHIGMYEAVASALFRDQLNIISTGKVWESVASVLTAPQQKRVQELVNDPSVAAGVQRDLQAGRAVPLQQTPTLVVSRGSTRYPITGNLLNYDLLKRLINDMAK